MAITKQGITDYLATCSQPLPEVKVAVSYRLDEVTFFKPIDLAYVQPIFTDPKLDQQLDILCKRIEHATNQGVKDYQDSLVEEEPIEDLTDTILAKIEALAPMPLPTLEVTPLCGVKPSLRQKVQTALLEGTPWTVYSAMKSELLHTSDGKVITELLDMALGEEDIVQLQHMGYEIVTETFSRLDEAEKLGKKVTKGKRPADIYRALARPLRFLNENHDFVPVPMVGEALKDLLLSQSMPQAELDNPDWVDPYTGEEDAEAQEFSNLRIKDPVSDPSLLEELGWTEADADAFNSAQEGFNADTDQELELNFHDEWDVRIPQFREMQEDYQPTERLGDLRNQIQWHANELKWQIGHSWKANWENSITIMASAISKVKAYSRVDPQILHDACENCLFFALNQKEKQHKKVLSLGIGIWKHFSAIASQSEVPHIARTLVNQVFVDTRKDVRESDEAKIYIRDLNEMSEDEAPQDIYVLFMAFQHAMCFGSGQILNDDTGEQDVDDRQLVHLPIWGTLADFDDTWGDFVLECMNDPRGVNFGEPDQEFIDAYSNDTIDKMAMTGDWQTKSACLHPAFLKGYLVAAVNSKDMTSKGTNVCEEAGWEAFRCWKSSAGNNAYHSTDGDYKQRMKAFWSIYNQEQRRASERFVKGVKSTGLTLSGGRQVNWYVATLKIQRHELDLDEADRARLKNLLSTKGWGKQLQSVL